MMALSAWLLTSMGMHMWRALPVPQTSPSLASHFKKPAPVVLLACRMHFLTKIGPSADLKLTNSAPGSVASGSTLTYTIVVSNLGPDTASSLTISDNTPSGTTFNSVSITAGSCTSPAPGSAGAVKCRLGSLAAGANVTETLVVNVTAASGSTITDKASVTSKTFDPNTKNNSATAKTSVT